MSQLTIELTIAVEAAGQLWFQEGVTGISTLNRDRKRLLTFNLDPADYARRIAGWVRDQQIFAESSHK
jgi:hypothetical protein